MNGRSHRWASVLLFLAAAAMGVRSEAKDLSNAARRMSKSQLYFTDKDGSMVRRLPYEMDSDKAFPEKVERNK